MKTKRIYGECLEALGIPPAGFAVIDETATPRVFDLVWCNNSSSTISGFVKQIVQTGQHPIVRSRYKDKSRDYLFYAQEIYGVVVQITDENQKVVYQRKDETNADRIRAMSDEMLAEWICHGISSDPCDYCEYNSEYCDGSPCRGKADAETIMDWLKRPAEVGKDGK